jgi:hypothetical protein
MRDLPPNVPALTCGRKTTTRRTNAAVLPTRAGLRAAASEGHHVATAPVRFSGMLAGVPDCLDKYRHTSLECCCELTSFSCASGRACRLWRRARCRGATAVFTCQGFRTRGATKRSKGRRDG